MESLGLCIYSYKPLDAVMEMNTQAMTPHSRYRVKRGYNQTKKHSLLDELVALAWP